MSSLPSNAKPLSAIHSFLPLFPIDLVHLSYAAQTSSGTLAKPFHHRHIFLITATRTLMQGYFVASGSPVARGIQTKYYDLFFRYLMGGIRVHMPLLRRHLSY